MAIKSLDITVTGELKLPILMQSVNSGIVVLFTDNCSGVVVLGNEDFKTGRYSEEWKSWKNNDNWRIFKGDIIISNE